MAEKRKISVRKIIQLALTAIVAVCCVIAMVSASSIEGDRPLKGEPVVHIKNGRKYHFIEQQKIMDLAFHNGNIDVSRTAVSRFDLRGIEQAIMSDPWVADAQVFIDIDRTMHLYVTQRVPVARFFNRDGNSYYVDGALHTMPLSDNYTYYTTVVTNVPYMGNDSTGLSIKKQIVSLVKEIQSDSFWNAQVAHIAVDSAGSFELMPVLGNQRIFFGDTSRMEEKFSNLLAFYRNVMNKIGWDKYETLDVRFRGQVIASPALPYTGPVDKAVANMNWITSIEKTEAQKDSLKALQVQAKVEERQVRAMQKQSARANTKGAVQPKPGQAANAKVKVKQPAAGQKTTVAKAKNKEAAHATKAPAKAEKGQVKTKAAANAKKPVAKPAAKAVVKKNVKLPAKKAVTKNKNTKAQVKDKKKNSKDVKKEKKEGKYVYPEKK